jgi:limonene-1,2-epoxide hydrolase
MRLGAAVQEQVTDSFAVMRLSCPTPRSVAERFAKALDADDFESAVRTLSSECQYSFRDALIKGPDTIIQSYRDASEKAKRLFHRIEYGSELVEIGAERVVVRFWDRLEVQGRSHLYTSRQQLQHDACCASLLPSQRCQTGHCSGFDQAVLKLRNPGGNDSAVCGKA